MSDAAAIFARLQAQLPLDRQAWDPDPGRRPEAAVLVPLTDEAEPRVLLGRRGRHLKTHPGEVAFPGGKREPSDASPWVTALREAEEEVGIRGAQVTPLGELAPMITRTDFEVHPCVARVPCGLELVVDTREFDSVFYQPLAVFADASRLQTLKFEMPGKTYFTPQYQIDGDNIWGVTAAILGQLASVAYGVPLEMRRGWSIQA
ncbi:coenzyme A pyrophosphatase [Halioglobus japonicus]|uniref:NUDIX hydrolase n=1 Tax=Halioglobus japonicus TaxID=930805 RepID=UPI001475AFAE|nr:CoA pyrophosphatase [Halioglobus japonicus]GHD07628.1 coenzyme A pyrophosphatase [Halioglobus japonicus]